MSTIGTVVEVYKNIHRSRAANRTVYSIRDATTKKVVDHSDIVILADAEFKVSEAGRQRVLREKRKNVHAIVRGTRVGIGSLRSPDTATAVTYNPYRYDSFVQIISEKPVHQADVVELGQGVIAWNVR